MCVCVSPISNLIYKNNKKLIQIFVHLIAFSPPYVNTSEWVSECVCVCLHATYVFHILDAVAAACRKFVTIYCCWSSFIWSPFCELLVFSFILSSRKKATLCCILHCCCFLCNIQVIHLPFLHSFRQSVVLQCLMSRIDNVWVFESVSECVCAGSCMWFGLLLRVKWNFHFILD